MSVNKYQLHVMVLPEDDANRQIANGFLLDPSLDDRAIQVLPVAGGWAKVFEDFKTSHIRQLQTYPKRHLVLLIDFDGQVASRMQLLEEACPSELRDRVYLIGTQSEPEPLRRECGDSLEEIGKQLGQACADGEEGLWAHHLLAHNQAERSRLNKNVKPFLFQH